MAGLAAAQEPAPDVGAGAWEALVAIERERFRRGRTTPLALAGLALAEIALGTVAVVEIDDPTPGGVLIAGGATHGAMAFFAFESNHRRRKAFEARLAAIDPARPGALPALADSLRRSAENDARWHTFTLGAHLALPAAGVVTEVLGCTGLFEAHCEPEPVLALGIVGLAGGIDSALRWRASARLAGDLALVDQGIPTGLGQ